MSARSTERGSAGGRARGLLVGLLALLCAVSGRGALAADPQATPQRPTVSFNASTAPAHLWELESGGLVADGGSAIPLFLKYGLTDDTELEIGLDAVRQVEQIPGTRTSVGDLSVGFRSRVMRRGDRSAALAGWLKLPTAVDGVGTGETDAGVVGVFSMSRGSLSLDTNLWVSALGREGGSTLGQVQAVAALWMPAGGCWSGFAELSLQSTAGEGDGGLAGIGMACASRSATVFDVAAGRGWSDGYPDWLFTIGFTRLFAGTPAR